MIFRRLRWFVSSVSLVLCGAAATVGGQQPLVPDAGAGLELRATLEAEAVKAESLHRNAEAFLLRTRLIRGDFQEGDRVVVQLLGSVQAPAGTNDTVTIRAGKLLPMGAQFGDVPLEGVLRSEITEKVSAHLGRFLQNSAVKVTTLLRLSVQGMVRGPGYYYVAPDVLLSDVIMKAGGPATNTEFGPMTIRRSGELFWSADDTKTALTEGMSLDRLHLKSGDELLIEPPSGFGWQSVLSVFGAVSGLIYTLQRFLLR
ncbi:MAG: hypothetical protein V4550_06170 [Gemmatimonadota bacterium]